MKLSSTILYSSRPQVEHETWWDTYKFFNQRARAIMADWARDRRELMDKARGVFTEACVAHELEEVKLEYSKRHEALRDALYNQVWDCTPRGTRR